MTDALAGKEEDDRVWTAPSEEDPTYRLLVDCNQLAVDIDNEIGIIHNFMRDKYRLKFPELESLVHHPIDYARVVQAIGTTLWCCSFSTLLMPFQLIVWAQAVAVTAHHYLCAWFVVNTAEHLVSAQSVAHSAQDFTELSWLHM